MNIRKSCLSDLEEILQIYVHARIWMKKNGNPTQWGDDWPERWAVERDIEAGNSYVTEHDGSICGVFAFIIGEEPTYRIIEDGHWRNDEPYGTIHRLASDGSTSGVFAACLKYCEQVFPNIRMDTHRDNHIMQHLLEKHGYEPCGTIYVEDGTARIAYQKAEREHRNFQIEKLSGVYTVKHITKEDIPVLYDFCKANQTYYSYMKMQPTPENLEEDITALPPGKSLEDKYFVGFWEGERLNAILDLICGYPDEHTVYIGWFMLEKDCQKKGLGSALITEILSYLKDQGVRSVQLACLKENREGLAFWQKNGFMPVEVGNKQQYVCFQYLA